LEKDPASRIKNAEIALYMLRGLSGQDFPGPFTTKEPKATSRQNARIQPTGFVKKTSFSASFSPNKAMVFQGQGDPVIGLEYDNYFELRYLATNKQRMLIKTGAVQVVDDACFVFANTSKLLKYNVADEFEECLLRLTEANSYFCTDYGYLLLSNKYRSTYFDLKSMQDFYFSQPSYLTDNHVAIFPDGDFCISGGPSHQHIYWRDKQTVILGQWELNGLIVCLTCGDGGALVLTLDMQNTSHYIIWVVRLNAEPQKRSLADNVMHYTYTKGYFFWITTDQRLFMCGIDLIFIELEPLPSKKNIQSFNLTCDHRWLTTLSIGSDNQSIVDCYQANGDYLYV